MSLTFTAANYNSPHTVTITGLNDEVQDGNQAYRIVLDAAMSTDPNYNGLNPVDVFVSNTDNDTAGITVSAAAGNTREDGTTTTSRCGSTRSRAEPTPSRFRSPAATRPKAPSCSLRWSSRPPTGRAANRHRAWRRRQRRRRQPAIPRHPRRRDQR
jgi:hypothetical protein